MVLGRDRAAAGLLAAAAERLRPDPDTRGALLTAISDEPRLESTIYGGRTDDFGLVLLGNEELAAYDTNGVDIVDLAHHRIVRGPDLPGSSAIAATSNGRMVAVGDISGTVVFWDATRGARGGASLQFGAPVSALAFSPDGRTLAVALGILGKADPASATNTTRLVDVATRRTTQLLGGHAQADEAVTFTADGKQVVTGGNDGLIITHDAATGSTIGATIAFHAPGGAPGGVFQFALSPDGLYVVVMGFDVTAANQPFAIAYNRATGGVLKTIAGNESIGNLAFDGQGRHLLVAGIDGVQVLDVPSFAPHGPEIVTQHGAAHAEFLASGLLAVSGLDGTITLWGPDDTVASGRPVPGSPTDGGRFSPDGSLLALVATDDTVTVYRTRDLSRIGTISVEGAGQREPTYFPTVAAFSPDSHTLAVGDRFGRVRFFDAPSLRPLGPPLQVASGTITQLDYSPSGNTVLASTVWEVDNGIHIIDVAARTSRVLEPPVPIPVGQAFSPDGKWLLVPSFGGTLTEYPIVDGEPGHGRVVRTPSADPIVVAISPDGRAVATGTPQGAILLLDAQTFRQLGPPIPVSLQNFATLVFSPDGRYIAAQDAIHNIRLVDLSQRAVVGAALPGTTDQFDGVSFSPDGRTLVLGGRTGSVLLDLDVTTWLARACARAGRDLTSSEIAQYFSSAPRADACPPGR